MNHQTKQPLTSTKPPEVDPGACLIPDTPVRSRTLLVRQSLRVILQEQDFRLPAFGP